LATKQPLRPQLKHAMLASTAADAILRLCRCEISDWDVDSGSRSVITIVRFPSSSIISRIVIS